MNLRISLVLRLFLSLNKHEFTLFKAIKIRLSRDFLKLVEFLLRLFQKRRWCVRARLYKALSERENPYLKNTNEILSAVGMHLAVVHNKEVGERRTDSSS